MLRTISICLILKKTDYESLKQMYRTRFIYYCMTSRGDNENCTVLFFCCNCIMMQPDEQPDRHMHLTYPWSPVALVTAILRGISVS
ncbi:hypothetical protein T05_11551, partial [Trichinella murrelli]